VSAQRIVFGGFFSMDNSKAFANAVCAGIDAGAVSSHKDLQSLKARQARGAQGGSGKKYARGGR
jgi:hypothetical protein